MKEKRKKRRRKRRKKWGGDYSFIIFLPLVMRTRNRELRVDAHIK